MEMNSTFPVGTNKSGFQHSGVSSRGVMVMFYRAPRKTMGLLAQCSTSSSLRPGVRPESLADRVLLSREAGSVPDALGYRVAQCMCFRDFQVAGKRNCSRPHMYGECWWLEKAKIPKLGGLTGAYQVPGEVSCNRRLNTGKERGEGRALRHVSNRPNG